MVLAIGWRMRDETYVLDTDSTVSSVDDGGSEDPQPALRPAIR